MDDIDRQILNLIQEEFPLTGKPYAEVGRTVGLSGEETLRRVVRLKEEGYIRRIGPILERKKLGYASTLCGVHVDRDRLIEVAQEINKQHGITHNYEREGELNLWFTITKRTKEELDLFLKGVEERFTLTIYRFPEKRIFKIKTYFPL